MQHVLLTKVHRFTTRFTGRDFDSINLRLTHLSAFVSQDVSNESPWIPKDRSAFVSQDVSSESPVLPRIGAFYIKRLDDSWLHAFVHRINLEQEMEQ